MNADAGNILVREGGIVRTIFATCLLVSLALESACPAAAPLTTLDYKVTGQVMQVTPVALSVPKGIPGSIGISIPGAVPGGAFVEATLRGPSFPARRLVGAVNAPLLLPPLNLVGDYSLDGIRLVSSTGETLLEGTPASVPVHVFDEVLVSRVTSRPLTLEEIQGKGIVIDEQNFRAIEFEVGFVLDGVTIPVKFPVVAPAFSDNTEIIPAAELEERLRQAEAINNELSQGVVFPPELETAKFDIQVKGINFQFVDEDDGTDLALSVPPIPALMVIPGNIGFLNQFFSVMIFTENGAPAGSGLSATNIAAELVLPLGPDRVAGTFPQPGDDPLRFARVGEAAVIQPVQPVRQPGPDGKLGTADDVPRLRPGETGQGEFLVEGLQEGLHVMDLKLTADLEGLAAGVVKIQGRAAGSVLVRNPKFSFAFAHPRTVRAGEPYDAFVTILNTSQAPANLVSVTLNNNSISGGVLESDETVQLGTILPGQTTTAKFRIRSQRTGAITFSNITTSDDSLIGRFRLHAGVDERGVSLSPDTLVLPNFVDELPAGLLAAANRVLGQALSIAKAGQTPPGLLRVNTTYLKQKAIELAEAGQRVRYGEALAGVLPDLLLDWQGAREFSAGWDQILRETNAGLEWRQALIRAIEDASPGFANTHLIDAARNFAGRGETWFLGAVSVGDFQTAPASANELNLVKSTTERATLGTSTLAKALGYPGRTGAWIAGADAGVFEWKFATAVASQFQTSVVLVRADGTASELLWRPDNIAAGARLSYDATAAGELLAIDDNGDGTVDRTLAAQRTNFTELPPAVLTVRQEPEVLVGRPLQQCTTPQTTNAAGDPVPINNYANVLAVLFSKPMTQSLANVPAAYTLDGGNEAVAVQVQPGGRLALLTMREPVGNLVPRSMSVAPSVKDARGNPLVTAPVVVESRLVEGVTVRGRVVRADGSFSAGVPVTLTYYDEVENGLMGCLPFVVRSSQVFTDAQGQFQFDFVLGGIPYSVSATDTSGLSAELIAAILESTHGDSLNRARLLELANSPSVQNTLLAGFVVGALPQAIAKAEGLDRALVRDLVEVNSPREGTTVVYALRFRGRGAVAGQVLAADGITPVPNAAVNLFPDPSSRELGRGLFSDGDGRFAFFGVPLGTFSVEATSPAGPARVISDVITTAGETKNIAVVLSASAPPLGELQGRVTEPDGTPHAGAAVFVGRFDPNSGRFGAIVAIATSDTEGYWHATSVTAELHDVIALSADGKRKGERRDILTAANAVNTVNLTLQARATVTGRVETSTGIAVENALVGGGDALVRTDALGRFTLTGVPTGQRSIAAALERDPAAGITFPRLGSGSVNVLPGADNFVIVRLASAARIIGRVLDANGAPVPNADVAIPESGGFSWVYADDQGNFEFAGLSLGKYDLSAPAPPHEDPFDGEAAAKSLATASQEEMLATIGEAFAAFTGVNNPLLNGEGATFNPSNWGFTKDVTLGFDGQTVVADVRFLGIGTIGGIVKNGQGVPIGARVRLTGVGPSLVGKPTMVIRGERNSDPALGTFEFPDQALIGDWGLQAASPFFPVVISTSGRTTTLAPDDTGNVLQFPAVSETNGSLAGLVLNPDGSPVGTGVKVQISFGPDFIIQTDANGRFATQAGTFTLPATNGEGRPGVGYTVTATDESNGATGRATVTVMPSQVNSVTVRLLGRGDAVVTVVRADGSAAAGAEVEIQGGAYPNERFEGTTGAAGQVTIQNVFEGPYGASAVFGTGLTRIAGRINFNVAAGATTSATLTLAGTGTVNGVFLSRDGVTPISFANVALGGLAFTSTGADGRFAFPDVPLGTYRVAATDAVTGRSGSVNATLSITNEIREVTIIETALGEVFGRVVNALGNGNVPDAQVTLRHSDPFVPQRTVTTGPDGAFRFPGTPAGAITLEAEDPVTGGRGTVSTTLPETAATFEVNLALAPVANLTVTVLEADGTTPATLTTVRILVGSSTLAVDTDAQGRARFEALPLAMHRVTAESRAVGFTRRWAGAFAPLTSQGAEETLALTLRGVGSVTGTVFQADGTTPVSGAQVTLTIGEEEITVPGGVMKKPSAGQTENVIASAQGLFTFTNIPTGDVRLTATAQSLGASENATVASNGQTVTRDLTLTASGTVAGRIVRANGTTPAAGTDVLITFTSQSGLPGRVNARTLADGLFSVGPVPVGTFHAEITNADFGGIARLDSNVTTNNETVNLGDITLDEAFPTVVQVTPSNTASGVSTTTTIELLFSEPLAVTSVEASGVFVRRSDTAALVPATLTLTSPVGESALRLVRLVPLAPLVSEKTYQIVVVDGDLLNAVGAVTNRGPRDLVGRSLASLFSATFTTRDDTPPVLLSFTPANNAEQVDTRSVVRLSFDEPLAPGAVITLTGPGGAVAGTTSLGVNNLVLVFTPTADLPPNATFTASVSGLADVAGNSVAAQPLSTTFKSLDTIGPAIATLRIKNNQTPVAGSTVTLETLLAAGEPGVTVRFTADFQTIGTTASDVLELPFTLPASGTLTIRAIAIDRFGNEGPFAELSVTVLPNSPPVLTLTRLNPPSGSVATGSAVSVRISATDDSGITELKAAMTGAATAALQTTTGADITLSGVVSSTAGPENVITVVAQATDTSGIGTGEQTFTIPISDGTPPTLAFEGTAPTGVFAPGATISLPVRGRDNFGVTRYTLDVTGAFTASSEVLVNPASKDDVRTLSVIVPGNAPVTGAAFAVAIRAEDATGRLSTPLSTTGLRMVDQTPPLVSAFDPVGDSVNVSSRPTLTITFNEALDPASITSANVQLVRDADAVVIPTLPSLNAGGTVITLTPTTLPLEVNKTHRLLATTGLTDTSGNALAGNVPSLFTTADFRISAPLASAQVVEGQPLTISTTETFSFISRQVRFFVNNVADGADDTSTPFERVITVPLLADVPGGTLPLRADLLTGSDVLLGTSTVNVLVRSANADSDGDGLLNGQEIATGSDPFRADAGEDPDTDGLSNAQEVAAGTKANDSDTDDDFLNDGAEIAATTNPLNPDTDGDGLLDGRESLFGTNPKLADTDGDTLSDGFEVGIGRISSISDTARTWLAAKADAESRGGHLLTLTSAAENTAFVTLFGASASTAGAWIGHSDRFIEGTFRPVTGEAGTFTNFGSGQPDNFFNEDAVQLLTDAARSWNDAPDTGFTASGYILETGFYTDPLIADTDGDGVDDAADTFPGQQARAPVAVNDSFLINAGEVRIISIATELLNNDSDPDGPPFALFAFTQPPQGSVTQANATTLTYTPAGGFSGTEQFTYSIRDADGLTATATVSITVDSNHRPVAGALETNVIEATQQLVVLPGTDLDNNPLTARILSLPTHGSLFQFTGSAAGAAITSVPANVTDSQRRVVYQPATGYLGDDGFTFSVSDGALESIPADALLQVVPTFAPVTDDLWDVGKGAAITASSGFHGSSAGNNMFGAANGVEPGNAIFADGHPAGFTHFIEWQTPSFLRVEGAKLFALNDGGGSAERGVTEMRLFGRMDATDPFTLLATCRPGANPYFINPLKALLSFAPFVGQQFRAEFDQFGSSSFPGPRILELDAIAETVVLVSTGTLALRNATATFSQSSFGGFNASNTIDGNPTGTSWAVHGSGGIGNTNAQTIVWETQADVAAQTGESFTFTLAHTHIGSGLQLGRFRLSATTDARTQFADGLQSGGDVSANWQILAVESFTASNGAAGTVQGDGSVLVSGATSDMATYTVRVAATPGLVTGFRLEALEDPSLPGNGPGRESSAGNFHLSEVTVEGVSPMFSRAPQSVADTAQTQQDSPVTTGNVLANDTDPEGDTLAVFDFTQPSAGTGSVVNNGNGTFTYTPPNAAFTGLATFTYRATDGHQPGAPATVTITVTPTTFTWNNPAGGNWNTASNWTPAHVPVAGEIAKIDLSGTYTVTLDTSPTVLEVFLGATSGTQTLNINGQTLTTTNALIGSGGGRLLLNSGAVSLPVASTVPQFNLGGGTLTGAGNLTVTGTFNWSSGTLSAGGELIVASGAFANLTGSGNKFINRVLRNHGTINYTGTFLLFNNGTSNGRIENETDGFFSVDGDGDFSISSSGTNAFNNAGWFYKSGAGLTTFFGGTVPFNNTGLVSVASGTLQFQGGFSQTTAGASIDLSGGSLSATTALTFAAGSVTGAGTITANVTNSGATFDPIETGGSRTLTITGTYTQEAGGTLEFDLDSDVAGGAFDKLAVSGAATFNGTVSLRNSVGLVAQVFPLITYASRTGTFATINVTNNGSATANFLANQADFTVSADPPFGGSPPPPEPSSAPSGTASTLADADPELAASLAGEYNGFVHADPMLPAPNGTEPGLSTEGLLTLTVTASSGFSGNLRMDGETLTTMSGSFDELGVARFGTSGTTTLAVVRPDKPSLVVALTMDLTPARTKDTISGTVTATNFEGTVTTAVSTVVADRAFYDGLTADTTVPAAYLGASGATQSYTVVLPSKALYESETATLYAPFNDLSLPNGALGDRIAFQDTAPTGLTVGEIYTLVDPHDDGYFRLEDSLGDPAPIEQGGQFTVALDPDSHQVENLPLAKTDYPQGDGYGFLTVSKAGVVTLTSGKLADGTVVTASTKLSKENKFPLFLQLYTGTGYLSGDVALDSTQPESDLAAVNLDWLRPPDPTSQYYPDGWPETIDVGFMGARYAVTFTPTSSVLRRADTGDADQIGNALLAADVDNGNAGLSFFDGQLAIDGIERTVSISTTNEVTKVPASDTSFTLTLAADTGAFNGTFVHTLDEGVTTPPTTPFEGVIYQKGPTAGGYGYFLTRMITLDFTGESGWVGLFGD